MNSKSDPPDFGDDDAGEGGDSSPQDPHLSESNSETVEELFNRTDKELIGHVMGLGMTRSEAEEVAAESFEKVISRKDPQPVGNLGGYLYTTAQNLAANRRRQRAVRERSTPIIQAQPGNEIPLPEQLVIASEQQALLLRAVEELPPRLRMAIRLRVWDELTDQQIARKFAAIGIELGERTVRRYILTGRKLLRQMMRAANFPPEGNKK